MKISRCIECVLRWIKRCKWWLFAVAGGLVLLVVVPSLVIRQTTMSQRYNAESMGSLQKLPQNNVAIVFGAGVMKNGQPTPYLRWRVQTAVQLFKMGKVHHLLMSGDNSSAHYNEPVAMQRYAESLGVPADAITLDYAGYDTYDTCYRARYIFGVTSATLVSQAYHVPRAMFTCDGLGVRSIGVDAIHIGRAFTVSYILRELLSTDKAMVQNLFKPKPGVLGYPIFID